ncbi:MULTISPECIES: NAD(P)-dependent oxidoreductase [Pseudomonas]|uniref:NAD(P)-dependent oxidoreductase n=1 Tax=Pseudomonas TaxID=286 RepID=UPI0007B38221|nr:MULTISPECIES: NAD(P)-dependent oxidoreductase [Pseudomonas]AZC48490.1 3-hydroxyisobutyrate dehydrogenase family protein [Pseudomonas chlororaphis subsp. piscium]AZC55057.1 3-hydroxyisobutyrate dehydrogenase family protein [Pseudomonas chlororaphis subsp. piscium]AZC61377.1 3-hydroxyisobutyrate dehydrogenase family protein [Pseudomonas chlororaphis subsp. piscium]AZC67619.1 3-hydroxyisobutyrate dehydrogenase family protein [Pseudomonas chlororaphis subsp. piscium]AZC73804.1 3-hydroxyisobutyr
MTIDRKPLTLAVLGTGLIGAPVARNLSQHGFRVNAWNRTAAKAQALAPDGIQVFSSPADAVQGADIVLTLLKDGPSVLQAMQAAAPALSKGTLWLQLSTVGIEDTATLAAFAAEHGLVFYDTPVQGTRQPAEQGQLIILASGPAAARADVQPVFDAIGKRTLWVSEQVGASSRLKLALNSWVFALTHGIAESIAIAKGLGVDPALVVDVVKDGPLDSGYFRLKAAAILADDYSTSFSIANAVKDARLVVDAALQAGVRVDAAQAGLSRFERALEAGHGDKDMAASYLA